MFSPMFSQATKFRIAIAIAIAFLMTAIVVAVTTATVQANPPEPEILPGTVITNQNWGQYRGFMSEGLIALFEGSHFWRMPAEVELEIGPTRSIPLPKKYLADT